MTFIIYLFAQRLLIVSIGWKKSLHLFFIAIAAYILLILTIRNLPKTDIFSIIFKSSSIGNSTYAGYPYQLTLLTLTLFVGILLIYLTYFFNRSIVKDKIKNNIIITGIPELTNFWVKSIVLIVTFIIMTPYLVLSEGTFTNIPQKSWDGQNLLYWDILLQKGFLPYRDFWWPYFGSYIFKFENNLSLISQLFLRALQIILVYKTISQIFKNQKIAVLSVLFILNLYLLGLIYNPNRFFNSFVLILVITNIYFLPFKEKLPYLFFIPISYFLEPLLSFQVFIIFILAVLFLKIYQLYSNGYGNSSNLFTTSRLISILLINFISSIIAIYALSYFSNLSFKEIIYFINDVRKIPEFTTQVPGADFFRKMLSGDYIAGITPFIIAPALFCSVIKGNNSLPIRLLLVSLLGCTVMLSAKHLLRGPAGIELAIFGLMSSLILILINIYEASKRFLFGLFIALFLSAAVLGMERFVDRSTLFVNFVKNSLINKEFFEFKVKNYKSEFYSNKVKEIIGVNNNAFFIFGDDPLVYIMADLYLSRHPSMYDSSTIKSQNEIINSIKKNNIKIVAISKKDLDFDGVHYTIRNYLLSNYIFANYGYYKSTDNYILLHKFNDPQIGPIRDVFGPNIYLGRIPELNATENISSKLRISFTDNISSYFLDLSVNGFKFKVHGFRAMFPHLSVVEIPISYLWPCSLSFCDKNSFTVEGHHLKLEYIE